MSHCRSPLYALDSRLWALGSRPNRYVSSHPLSSPSADHSSIFVFSFSFCLLPRPSYFVLFRFVRRSLPSLSLSLPLRWWVMDRIGSALSVLENKKNTKTQNHKKTKKNTGLRRGRARDTSRGSHRKPRPFAGQSERRFALPSCCRLTLPPPPPPRARCVCCLRLVRMIDRR